MTTEPSNLDLLQQTVSDLLAERIRNEIILGNFKPGERLRLRDLAQRYKISTMPVREALQLLQLEGLVTGEPRKGVTVTQLNRADVEDIYEIRATLEALATRLATPQVTADLLASLRSITVEMDQAEESSDMVKVVEANYRFHAVLYAASERTHLCELISSLRHRTAHYLHLRTAVGGAPLAHQEHYDIIAALEQGNADLAATLMYEHIANAGRSIVAFLQQTDSETVSQRVSRTVKSLKYSGQPFTYDNTKSTTRLAG